MWWWDDCSTKQNGKIVRNGKGVLTLTKVGLVSSSSCMSCWNWSLRSSWAPSCRSSSSIWALRSSMARCPGCRPRLPETDNADQSIARRMLANAVVKWAAATLTRPAASFWHPYFNSLPLTSVPQHPNLSDRFRMLLLCAQEGNESREVCRGFQFGEICRDLLCRIMRGFAYQRLLETRTRDSELGTLG